jgi:hypothetical protein
MLRRRHTFAIFFCANRVRIRAGGLMRKSVSVVVAIAVVVLSVAASAAPGGSSMPGSGSGMPSGGPPSGGPPGGPKGPPPGLPPVQPKESAYDRAEYLIKGERYDEALPLLQNILRDNPKDADTLNYLGFVNRKLKNYKESFAFYQRALAVDPEHKGAREYLGELYLQTGEIEKAREQLAELKRICVTNCEEVEDLAADIATYEEARAAKGGK